MRSFVTGVAAAVVALGVACPAASEEGWRAGFQMGVNLARVETSGSGWIDAPAFRGDLAGGVVVERRLGGGLSLESGFLVFQRSSSRQTSIPFGTGQSDPVPVKVQVVESQTCAEVPLLLRATFGTGRLRPWVAAGPTLQIHLSSRGEMVLLEPGPGVPAGSSGTGSTDDRYRSVVLGFDAAAGLDYRLDGGTALRLGLTWSPGLSNLLRSESLPGYPVDTRYVRSDDVRVLAGVTFSL